MNALLDELIRKFFGSPDTLPEPWRGLFEQLNVHLQERETKSSGDPSGVLQSANEYYRLLVEHAPVGVIIHEDGVIRYVNPYALRLSGMASAEELVGRKVLDFTHPDYWEQTYANWKKLENGESIPIHEQQAVGRDGRTVDIEVSSTPFRVGGKLLIQTMFRDITDAKRLSSVFARLVESFDSPTEGPFFPGFAESLGRALDARFVFIGELDAGESDRVNCLAFIRNGEPSDLPPIALAPAPRTSIFSEHGPLLLEADALATFPAELVARTVVALPLFDRSGAPAGLSLIGLERTLDAQDPALPMLRIFAGRAAAEIDRLRGEQRVFDNEQGFRMLMEQAADGIVVTDAEGMIRFVNERMCQIVSDRPENMLGRKFRDFLSDEETRLLAFDHKKLSKGKTLNMQRTLILSNGNKLRIDISANRLSDGRVMASIRDMSERYRVEEERKSYLDTLAMLEEVALELDADFRIVRVSDSWDKLFKDESGAAPVGRKLESWIHPDYQYYLTQNLHNLVAGKKMQVAVHVPAPLDTGANMWLEGKFIPVRGEGETITGIRGVLRDVTLDHLTDRQITFYAYYDNLTGLPNRIRMEENLNRALNRAEHTGKRLAIGFIDLDNFDEINNYLGHRVGDLVLLYVTERLRDALGAGENLFRWGGDKFVVLLSELADLEEVRQIGRRLIEICRKPLEIEGELIHVSYSVGFAVYPDDGLTIEILMGQADRALGYAKSQGRFNFQLSREVPQRGIYREQLSIRNNLATAIAKREIKAYFQPKVAAKTHKVIGVEALARWLDENGRPRISPAMFIPVAENLGLISELGEQVLEQSLALIASLKKEGRILGLSVNVSRRQLFDPFFVDRIKRTIERHGMSAGDLTLEITESIAMLEVDFAIERLRSLHAEGFQLSIDDFGTGYSNLSQLHEMPVNELKVDMSFVRRIDTYEGLQVVQAITNMGRALNLDVVAEGVETAETVRRLEDLGVNILQGNFFARPLSEAELIKYLADQDP